MKKKLHSFLGHWKIKKAELKESVEELRNPGRGWYQIHTFSAEKNFPTDDLQWCLGDRDTLALVFIDIGYYREQVLDSKCLTNIDSILDYFSQSGLDMILRIAYDREGRAWESEPYSFSQVMEHMKQLSPILSKYAMHIYVYQGMLVGSWGEMHSSRFLATAQMQKLKSVLDNCLGRQSFLAVRRPSYWRTLHLNGESECKRTRMGLFDDGIFGSDTHLGTFGESPADETGWGAAWNVEDELAFEEKLCQYVPQGGEALYEEGKAEERSLADTVERLRRMRISYLNRVHDARILRVWKDLVWREKGPWEGMNGFDYIGRHLGYRFCVRNVSMTAMREKRGAETQCLWEISIENVGFSPCYQKTRTWLEWKDDQGQSCTKELFLELNRIMPGEVKTGTCMTVPAEGEVRLFAARKQDGRAICFANVPEGGKGVLLGRLVPP